MQRRLKDYFVEKMDKQPLGKKSLGCVFKNPSRCEYTSGELIEKAGMKGCRRGAAQISEKHANFIINTGGAKAANVTDLINDVKNKVKERFSVELEPEIEIL